LFEDQYEAFEKMETDLLRMYGRLLCLSYPNDGYEMFFQSLTQEQLPDIEEVREIWKKLVNGRVCQSRVREVFDNKEESEEFKNLKEVDTWYTGLFQIIFAKSA